MKVMMVDGLVGGYETKLIRLLGTFFQAIGYLVSATSKFRIKATRRGRESSNWSGWMMIMMGIDHNINTSEGITHISMPIIDHWYLIMIIDHHWYYVLWSVVPSDISVQHVWHLRILQGIQPSKIQDRKAISFKSHGLHPTDDSTHHQLWDDGLIHIGYRFRWVNSSVVFSRERLSEGFF